MRDLLALSAQSIGENADLDGGGSSAVGMI